MHLLCLIFLHAVDVLAKGKIYFMTLRKKNIRFAAVMFAPVLALNLNIKQRPHAARFITSIFIKKLVCSQYRCFGTIPIYI